MNSHRGRDVEKELAEVQAVYSDLDARPIHRQCELRADCCHFKLTGLTPFLTKGEAMLAASALRASGRRGLPSVSTGACPLLNPKTSRCLIYDSRPFACRTHFCKAAGGPYPRREIVDLIRRLEHVDKMLGGDGPRSLSDAMIAALKTFA